jgi:hypothetical protein
VEVGTGVGLRVGLGVVVGGCVGVRAMMVWVAARFAASAVSAMTVGRYSGGSGVGTELETGEARGEQAAISPRRQADTKSLRFITDNKI